MSFIKTKLVGASEIHAYAKVTKWIFFDEIILLVIAVAMLSLGFAIKDDWNARIFELGNTPIRLLALIGAALVVIAVFSWIKEFVKLSSAELALTDNRIIGKNGLISIAVLDSQLENFDAIEVITGISGRIGGFGKVIISTHGGSKYVYKKIANPFGFQKAVNEMLDARRRMDSKVIINRVDNSSETSVNKVVDAVPVTVEIEEDTKDKETQATTVVTDTVVANNTDNAEAKAE